MGEARLPDSGERVTIEGSVAGNDGNVLDEGLRDEQPVEGISMMVGEFSNLSYVQNVYWKKPNLPPGCASTASLPENAVALTERAGSGSVVRSRIVARDFCFFWRTMQSGSKIRCRQFEECYLASE